MVPRSGDPAEAVALVALARRDRLLRVNRRRLRWEDLEDCFSQATLELVARAKRDPFASADHIAHALEQKFSSRIDDRRRAIGGRSPIETAIARAVPVDAPHGRGAELEDRSAELHRQVVGRLEVGRLREVAEELTDDQRLVLACQISLDMDCAEFCRRFGWSAEKFRKVAQRARTRLRTLVSEYQHGERCRRLEPEVLAYAARVADEDQTVRAKAHLANCTACASQVRALDRASRELAAMLPAPAVANVGLLAKLAALGLGVRRFSGQLGRGGGSGAAGVAGGSAVGAGAAKLGVAAACLAGAAGGYAICTGVAPIAGHAHHPARPSIHHLVRAAITAGSSSASAGRPGARSVAGPLLQTASAVAHREFGVAPVHAGLAAPVVARAAAIVLLPPPQPPRAGAPSQAQREFTNFEH